MKKVYNSEQDVLSKLKINSFEELTPKGEKKLSKIMGSIKKEIVPTIINKLPNSNEFCGKTINAFFDFGFSLLKENEKLYQDSIKPLLIVVEELDEKRKERPLNDIEIEQMIDVGTKMAAAAKERRSFMAKVLTGIGVFGLGMISIICHSDIVKTKITK